MRRLIASLIVCAAAYAVHAAPVGAVHDVARGLSFTVPDGYTDYPEGRSPPIIYAFARGKPDDASFMLLHVVRMGGPIGRGPVDPEMAERAARKGFRAKGVEPTGFELSNVRWKDFDLNLFVSYFPGRDKELVSLTAQVPLAREAIQIQLIGPAAEEATLSADLQAILASLDGPSNWVSDDERVYRIAELIGAAVGSLGGLALVLWWLRRRRRATAAS